MKKIAKRTETRGVKAGAKRGPYKKSGGGVRAQYTLVLSREERAKIDAMRGELSMSAYIRQKLGLETR